MRGSLQHLQVFRCLRTRDEKTMSKPLVTVFGATGAQGGSVIKFLVKDGGFRVRAVTRKPDGEQGKQLAQQGVEVVQADLDDVPSMQRALKDAEIVFGVTNFWEVFGKERAQGHNLVEALKAASSLKHVVFRYDLGFHLASLCGGVFRLHAVSVCSCCPLPDQAV